MGGRGWERLDAQVIGYGAGMDGAGEQRKQDVELAFDKHPGAARQARKALDALLVDPEDPIADDVRLAASEMVTNVVQHTTDGGVLRAHDPDPDVPLRLEVEDHDPRLPEPRDEADERGGRGLSIIDSVSDDWGVIRLTSGKVTWAEFDRQRRLATGTAPEESGKPASAAGDGDQAQT